MEELNELTSAEGRKTNLCFSVIQSCDISIPFLSLNETYLTYFRTISEWRLKILKNSNFIKKLFHFSASRISQWKVLSFFLFFIKFHTTSRFLSSTAYSTYFLDKGMKFQRGTKEKKNSFQGFSSYLQVLFHKVFHWGLRNKHRAFEMDRWWEPFSGLESVGHESTLDEQLVMLTSQMLFTYLLWLFLLRILLL